MIDRQPILIAFDELIDKADVELQQLLDEESFGVVSAIAGWKNGLRQGREIVALAREATEGKEAP